MRVNTRLIAPFLLISFFFVQEVFAVSPVQIDQLSCEYIQNPLGIDTRSPRFSWTMSSITRNQFQSAYEIIVSSNQDEIRQLKGTAWSTGKISSNQNIQI